MRLILSLTAAGACVLMGLCRAARLQAREKTLEEWGEAMARMESLVTHFSPPIPEILHEGGACAPTLHTLETQYALAPAQGLKQLWRALPREAPLKDEEWALLGDCVGGLGETTATRQKEALRRAREKWSPLMVSARKARERGVKMYCSLGWLGGAAVFILMQ